MRSDNATIRIAAEKEPARDEPRPASGAYEPPSVTKLGSFKELTLGAAGGGSDTGMMGGVVS